MELGLIEGNTLFVDGTKIRANAGMRESWSAERCQRVLEKTDAHIERILKECESVDASESNESSLVNHPELKDAMALKAKVEAISTALKQSGKTNLEYDGSRVSPHARPARIARGVQRPDGGGR